MSLQLGSKAPNFVLQNTEGKKVSFSKLNKNKKVVILFFPLAFSSVCTEELCTVRDNLKLYGSVNAKVVGISVDSFFTLKAYKKAENLNFTLLSDFNKKVSSEFGVLYSDFFGMKGVSKRAAFVINEEGTVTHQEVLEDSGQLPDFKAIQKAVSPAD